MGNGVRLTIVLLAGGRATRLPGKLDLRIGDESMLERVARRLRLSGCPLVLSVRSAAPLAGALTDVPHISDAYADAGPLGGLASAAAHVTTPLLFAAAADLPHLDARAIDAVVQRYEAETAPVEAVVPRHPDGTIEPLAALYDTHALRASAERAIANGRLRVSDTLRSLRVVYHEIPAVEESLYHNVNTAEDFEHIERP